MKQPIEDKLRRGRSSSRSRRRRREEREREGGRESFIPGPPARVIHWDEPEVLTHVGGLSSWDGYAVPPL